MLVVFPHGDISHFAGARFACSRYQESNVNCRDLPCCFVATVFIRTCIKLDFFVTFFRGLDTRYIASMCAALWFDLPGRPRNVISSCLQ